MAESQFRYRGLQVVVDTTQPAEFDMAELGLSEAQIGAAIRVLTQVPVSKETRFAGDVHIRRIGDYDFVYVLGRDKDAVVITLGGVMQPDPARPTEEAMKALGAIDVIRGAFGL